MEESIKKKQKITEPNIQSWKEHNKYENLKSNSKKKYFRPKEKTEAMKKLENSNNKDENFKSKSQRKYFNKKEKIKAMKKLKELENCDNKVNEVKCKLKSPIKREIEIKGEKLDEFKRILRERRKFMTKVPTLTLLKNQLELRKDESTGKEKPQIDLMEVQKFISFCQLGTHAYNGVPSWIKMKNWERLCKTVVVVVEGVGLEEFDAEVCTVLGSLRVRVSFSSPLTYGGNLLEELAIVPLSPSQVRRLSHFYISVKTASDQGESFRMLETLFQMKKPENKEKIEPEEKKKMKRCSLYKRDKFPRTQLLLSPWQMIEHSYPLPIKDTKYENFIPIKEDYAPATDKSPMFSLDCEMCVTARGSELTRISVINEKHEVVYERLVKPYSRILDYVTQFSGIAPEMLRNVWTRLEDVQEELRFLLPHDAILIGQSLNCDLNALKMIHPYVIDTSVIFNMSGNKFSKTKLRVLSEEFLSERIQCKGELGHDSIEDSIAAMKLVQAKLDHYLEWGNALLEGKRNEKEEKEARLLMEERDREPKEPFVRKYAELCICDKEEPQEFVGVKRKRSESTSALKRFKSTFSMFNDTSDSNSDEKLFQGSSLFKTLTRDNCTVSLIGRKEVVAEYQVYTPPCSKVEEESSRLVLFKEDSNKQVLRQLINKAADVTEKYRDLIYTHIQLKNKGKPLIPRVEKLVTKLKAVCPSKTLLCIVLAGNKESDGMLLADILLPELGTVEEIVRCLE